MVGNSRSSLHCILNAWYPASPVVSGGRISISTPRFLLLPSRFPHLTTLSPISQNPPPCALLLFAANRALRSSRRGSEDHFAQAKVQWLYLDCRCMRIPQSHVYAVASRLGRRASQLQSRCRSRLGPVITSPQASHALFARGPIGQWNCACRRMLTVERSSPQCGHGAVRFPWRRLLRLLLLLRELLRAWLPWVRRAGGGGWGASGITSSVPFSSGSGEEEEEEPGTGAGEEAGGEEGGRRESVDRTVAKKLASCCQRVFLRSVFSGADVET